MHFMEQWMYLTYLVFGYGTLIAGSLLLLVAALIVILWCLVKLHDVLPIARGVELAIAVRLHGNRYVNRVFWRAVQERATSSSGAAREIIRVVKASMPKEEEEEAA